MIIYLTTNLIDGKKYIGKDVQNKPSYLGGGRDIKLAIKKYGKGNFRKDILCFCETKEQMNEMEQYYIDYYSATISDFFYNISLGGDGNKGYKHTVSAKEKIRNFMSQNRKAEKHPLFGKKHSLESIKKISLKVAGRKNPSFGSSKYGKISMHDRETGDLLDVFETVGHAKEYLKEKFNQQSKVSDILKCCRGKIKYSKGFNWRFADV